MKNVAKSLLIADDTLNVYKIRNIFAIFWQNFTKCENGVTERTTECACMSAGFKNSISEMRRKHLNERVYKYLETDRQKKR